MKSLNLLILAFAFSYGASAEINSSNSLQKTNQVYSQKHHEGYFLKDGKLMMIKDGTTLAVTQAVTLTDGTTITTDGKVTWKDGKSQTLTDNDWVDMTGKIHVKKGMK